MKQFSSFGALASHLQKLVLVGHEAMQHAVKESAEVVVEDAKFQIGAYQPETGPFPAWAPLADSTEAEKARLGYPADAPLLRTGELRDSISSEVKGLEAVVGSSDDVMVYHELGTDRMPPRPVLGPALFTNRARIVRIIGVTAGAWLAGHGWKRPGKSISKD